MAFIAKRRNMEYFTDATIRFKIKDGRAVDIEEVDKKISKKLRASGLYEDDSYDLIVTEGQKDKLSVVLYHNFEFEAVQTLVDAVLKAGLKKFGRDKLIAYQTTAGCYFKNYVTKDGKFLDFCGDCYEDGRTRRCS